MNSILGSCRQVNDDQLLKMDWFTEEDVSQARLVINELAVKKFQQLSVDESTTLNKVIQLLEEVQNIVNFLRVLLERFHAYSEITSKLEQLIEHLHIFKVELLIVQELLVNCREGQTSFATELKSFATINKEFIIKAESNREINLIAIGHIFDYVIGDLFKRICLMKKYQHGKIGKQSSLLLFDARVLYSELNMVTRTIGTAIDNPHDDIFCLDKSHQKWQQIRNIWQSKELADAKQMQQSYDIFTKSIRIGHAIVFKRNKFQSKIVRNLVFLLGGAWYFALDSRTRKRALAHTCILEPQSACEVMNLLELPGIKHLLSIGLPYVAMNKKIYIDSVVEPITKEVIQKEAQDGTLNKITHRPLQFVNEGIHLDEDYRQELFVKTNQKIRIRILCHKQLEQPREVHPPQVSKRNVSILESVSHFIGITQPPQEYFETVLIHIHGGGFIAMSSGSHQCYTRMWANRLKIPIFSIDYGLAPKHPYPTAVDDCWQAYQWILTHLQSVYNVLPKKIILSGDSAGGNLCCSITGLAIKYGCKVPDGILLAYPVLDLKFRYSPSHIMGLKDAILSHTVMDICIKSYTDYDHCNPGTDPFISPVCFSDEILQRFPPVRIMGGQLDPIADHAYRFANSLIKNNINVKMIEYQEMSHGFLSFYVIKGMKEVYQCIEDSIDFIKELIQL